MYRNDGRIDDLRLHIEGQGGRAVAFPTLLVSRLGGNLAPDVERIEQTAKPVNVRELDRLIGDYGIPAASDLTEHELRLIAGQSGIDGIRRQLDAAGIPRRRGLGVKSVQEDRLRSTLGNRKLTDQDAETDRLTVEEMKLLPYVRLDELLLRANVDVINGNIKANRYRTHCSDGRPTRSPSIRVLLRSVPYLFYYY